MCAILGCYLEQPTQNQIQTLKQIFVESQIRGKHATGYSMIKNNKVWTVKTPKPAVEFVENYFDAIQPGDHTLRLIGHCRYSTSDLRYNQPMQNKTVSIVHNGVITQDPPELWGRYGYVLETSNDSELLLRSALAGNEPLEEFPEASIAAIELHDSGKMRWYRNGKRPAWQVKVKNGYFITSTRDIALRAGLANPEMLKPGVVYSPGNQTMIKITEELIHV